MAGLLAINNSFTVDAALDERAFDQPVPRRLVHRSANAEVFLTHSRRVGDGVFTVAAQWPRAHPFFIRADRRYDPMLVAETLRQSGLLVTHREFGVPLDQRFLMHELRYQLSEPDLRIGDAPAAVAGEVVCRDIRRRGRSVVGMRLTVEFHRDGQHLGHGESVFECVSPTVYGRLRGPLQHAWAASATVPLPAPIDPRLVGRERDDDVLLSPSGRPGLWKLRVDRRHPVLFDHPVDHFPGMALLEALRQAAQLAVADPFATPLACDTAFHGYVEFDRPCLISTCPVTTGPAPVVRVTAEQDGRAAVTAELRMATAGAA
ncbi:ScbA/BarX family gamma-butyrolactone biosynthesis protein [Streptomyces sp. NPDC001339]|uniref:ScbA/BarX family gamma-butyrolactone biosynthesis protein n=1 Tax=Streptomyces sp. NPDC001339 TaxID=3364563 RepID=UPI003686248E